MLTLWATLTTLEIPARFHLHHAGVQRKAEARFGSGARGGGECLSKAEDAQSCLAHLIYTTHTISSLLIIHSARNPRDASWLRLDYHIASG